MATPADYNAWLTSQGLRDSPDNQKRFGELMSGRVSQSAPAKAQTYSANPLMQTVIESTPAPSGQKVQTGADNQMKFTMPDFAYLDKNNLYNANQLAQFKNADISKLINAPNQELIRMQAELTRARQAEEARKLGDPRTDSEQGRQANLAKIAQKQDMIREALLKQGMLNTALDQKTPVVETPKPTTVATKPAAAPAVTPVAQQPELETIVAEPPAQAQSSGPLRPEPQGIDWEKVAAIAKSTGMSIIGVLQAAIAGNVAGRQGRQLDWAKDTLLGRNQAEQQAKDQEQRIADLDMQKMGKNADLETQLKMIDQAFAANQAAINREFEVKLQAAKTQEEKEQLSQQFAQRMKELQLTGAQRMQEIAAQQAGGKVVSSDPRGIGAFAK